jgi:hypothetical protein
MKYVPGHRWTHPHCPHFIAMAYFIGVTDYALLSVLSQNSDRCNQTCSLCPFGSVVDL